MFNLKINFTAGQWPRKMALMRLWQLNVCILLIFGLVCIGARVLAPAPSKKWDECAHPADAMARELCAEFR